MGPGGTMIYLFAMSVIPTVPAGWLTFADGVVYKAYDHGPRLWGISVTDRPAAGRRHHEGRRQLLPLDHHHVPVLQALHGPLGGAEHAPAGPARPAAAAPATAPAGEAHEEDDEHVLTYEEVTRAFEAAPPVPEPHRPTTGPEPPPSAPSFMSTLATAECTIRGHERLGGPGEAASTLARVIDVRLLRTDLPGVRAAIARRGSPELVVQVDEAAALDGRLRERDRRAGTTPAGR